MNIDIERLTEDSLDEENFLKLLNCGTIVVKYKDGNYFIPVIHNSNGFALLYHEEGKMINFALNYDNLIKNYELYFLKQ